MKNKVVKIFGHVIGIKTYEKINTYEVFHKGKSFILNISHDIFKGDGEPKIGAEIELTYEGPKQYRISTKMTSDFDDIFISDLIKQKQKVLEDRDKIFKKSKDEILPRPVYDTYNIGFDNETTVWSVVFWSPPIEF